MSGWGLGVWGSPDFGWGGVLRRDATGELNAGPATITANAVIPPYGFGSLFVAPATIIGYAGNQFITDPITLIAQPATMQGFVPLSAFGQITAEPAFVLNDYPGLDIGYGRFSAGSSTFLHDGPYQVLWGDDPPVWTDPLVWGFGAAYVFRMASGDLQADSAQVTADAVRVSIGSGYLEQLPAGFSGDSHVERYAAGVLEAAAAETEGYAFRYVFGEGELHARPICGLTYWIKFNKSKQAVWTPVDDRQPNTCSGDNNA